MLYKFWLKLNLLTLTSAEDLELKGVLLFLCGCIESFDKEIQLDDRKCSC